jgi:hypothetical protein
MAFTGIGSGIYASHVFYRARCSSPAVPLDSIDPYTGDRPVLMPDGGHVVSVGISSSQDPNAVDGSASLAITDIATDRWPGSSRGRPRASSTSRWPGAPRGYAAWQEPTSR